MLENALELLPEFKGLARLNSGNSYMRDVHVEPEGHGIFVYRPEESAFYFRGSLLAHFQNDLAGETVICPHRKKDEIKSPNDKKRILSTIAAELLIYP